MAFGNDWLLQYLWFTDEGKVHAFGSNYYGCLGMEEEDDAVLSPVPIPFFSTNPVEEISCGENHVAALTKDGEVYTWGCGEFGMRDYWGGRGVKLFYALPVEIIFRTQSIQKQLKPITIQKDSQVLSKILVPDTLCWQRSRPYLFHLMTQLRQSRSMDIPYHKSLYMKEIPVKRVYLLDNDQV